MKKLLVAAIALASAAAFAHNCPNEMKAIDAKMSTAKLADADMAKVKALRADVKPCTKPVSTTTR
jgi:hypothetical protein